MGKQITLEGGKNLTEYLTKLGRKLGSRESVSVGFLEKATYPTGTTAELRAKYTTRKKKGTAGAVKGASGGESVAEVAAANEWGDPANGRPPRPFFRSMIAKESPKWGENFAKALVFTDYDAHKSLQLMGEDIAGALRQSINEFTTPPLKPSTIKAKGFDKPLIDTSHMINSIDYEVE